jgi:hypothetical protein
LKALLLISSAEVKTVFFDVVILGFPFVEKIRAQKKLLCKKQEQQGGRGDYLFTQDGHGVSRDGGGLHPRRARKSAPGSNSNK